MRVKMKENNQSVEIFVLRLFMAYNIQYGNRDLLELNDSIVSIK
jgi:hypothetical protein